MRFPSFDKWIIETYPGIISFSRLEIAELMMEYQAAKLIHEEGNVPDESQLHESHE